MHKLSSKYSKSFKYLLRLLSSVILNTQPSRPNEKTDWALVFRCAKAHSVVGMLSYAVQKLEPQFRPAPDILEELLQIQRSEFILESNIQYETDNLLSKFKEKNLSAVLLKGMILKEYYPVGSMRTMTDVDILYDQKEKAEVISVFKDHGYYLELDIDNELHFRKQPFHYYELHADLLPQRCDTYEFFLNVRSNLRDVSDGRYRTLSLEYTYLYMLEHLARHIEKAGAGLRLVMDVFLFLRKEKDNLNTQIIDKGLEELKLKDFADRITSLADNWFSSDAPDTDTLCASFILNSSTFGLADNAILQHNIRRERRKGRKQNGFKYLFRSVFPDYKQICARFNSARKLKFLYPFYIPAYWCLRIFKDRNVKTNNIKKYFTKTDSDRAKYLISVMDDMGLSSRM